MTARHEVMLRCALVALIAAEPVCASAQTIPAVTLRDVWHYETGKSDLKSPRALAVTGDCTLWFADAVAGLFRLGCTAQTPQVVGAIGTKDGEYREPWMLARADGDSVLLYDRNLERVSVFAGDGTFGSTAGARLSSSAFAELSALNCVNGALQAWFTHFPSAADPEALPSLVLRIHAGSSARDTLTTLEGVSSVYWGSTFSGSHFPAPTSRRARLAFLRDGSFVVAYTDEARLVEYDMHGRAARTVGLALPPAVAVSKADRDAYADSLRRVSDAEMDVLHYDKPEIKQYQSQIATYVKEDAVFPEKRQLFDRIVVDANERSVWVLLPGTGKNYTRTWQVHSLTDGVLERRVTVSHKGAVIDAAVKDGVLYVVEQALGGMGRVAKYTQ